MKTLLLFFVKKRKKTWKFFCRFCDFPPWYKKTLFQSKHKNRSKNAYLCLSASFQQSTKNDTIRKYFAEKTTAESAPPPTAERSYQRGNMWTENRIRVEGWLFVAVSKFFDIIYKLSYFHFECFEVLSCCYLHFLQFAIFFFVYGMRECSFFWISYYS